jgi:hypothetical protein
MSASPIAQLVRKDLFLMRWPMVGTLAGGAVSLVLMPLGGMLTYVGGVGLLCALIILNIGLVLYAVAQERRDKVLLFVLSLPISSLQYTLAKVAATGIAFGVPWLVLTIATVVLIDLSPLPNGLLPFWMAVLAYLLFYFCALLAVALVKTSNGWHVTAITVGNISVNFFIPLLLARPAVRAHIEGPRAVWSGDLVALIALEIVLGFVVLGLAVWRHARRPDFV